jgi:hypothetical protein
MSVSFRNPQVGALARELADLRETDMREAAIFALGEALRAERRKRPLAERSMALADKAAAMAGPSSRPVAKDEIDELWGQ